MSFLLFNFNRSTTNAENENAVFFFVANINRSETKEEHLHFFCAFLFFSTETMEGDMKKKETKEFTLCGKRRKISIKRFFFFEAERKGRKTLTCLLSRVNSFYRCGKDLGIYLNLMRFVFFPFIPFLYGLFRSITFMYVKGGRQKNVQSIRSKPFGINFCFPFPSRRY